MSTVGWHENFNYMFLLKIFQFNQAAGETKSLCWDGKRFRRGKNVESKGLIFILTNRSHNVLRDPIPWNISEWLSIWAIGEKLHKV